MSTRTKRVYIWCGPVFTALFAIGFWPVAGFVPPPSPDDSAADVARMFAEDRDRIRIGLMISMVSATFFFPFVSVLSAELRRIEGSYSPMAYTQLAGGIGSICVFIFPLMSMQAANYRVDRDEAVVQGLNDTGWIQFIGLFGPPLIQCVAVAVVVLQDDRVNPVFPRWVGYFNIWVALLYVPGALLVFFKSGPLAWNGVFCWWIPAAAFFGWIVVMSATLLRAVAMTAQGTDSSVRPAAVAARGDG